MDKLGDKNVILSNVRRVCGQVQGIEKMIEENRDIAEILQQINAANSALKSIAKQLLQNYMQGCFGKASKISKKELEKLIEQMFKVM